MLQEGLLQDGLQHFMVPKYTHCHNLAAEFPAILPIGVPAVDCINNNYVHVMARGEFKQRVSWLFTPPQSVGRISG